MLTRPEILKTFGELGIEPGCHLLIHSSLHGVGPIDGGADGLLDALIERVGPDFIFGIDTYPASLAMFAGHDQTRWDRFSDFASPLVSHLDIFPMKTLAAWAQGLQAVCTDLGEGEALRLICRLVGYDGLGLPDRIADFALGEPDCEYRNVPLADFVLLDTAKARLLLPPGIPSYPIIQGGGAPHLWPLESIEAILAGLLEQDHQGYMLQGTAGLVEYQLRP